MWRRQGSHDELPINQWRYVRWQRLVATNLMAGDISGSVGRCRGGEQHRRWWHGCEQLQWWCSAMVNSTTPTAADENGGPRSSSRRGGSHASRTTFFVKELDMTAFVREWHTTWWPGFGRRKGVWLFYGRP